MNRRDMLGTTLGLVGLGFLAPELTAADRVAEWERLLRRNWVGRRFPGYFTAASEEFWLEKAELKERLGVAGNYDCEVRLRPCGSGYEIDNVLITRGHGTMIWYSPAVL